MFRSGRRFVRLGEVRNILSGKKNSQFQVKVEDFAGLLKNWLEGMPLDEMFLTLPVLARSKKTPRSANGPPVSIRPRSGTTTSTSSATL